jgi:hypothetical protein
VTRSDSYHRRSSGSSYWIGGGRIYNEYLGERDFKGIMIIASRDFNKVHTISRGRSIKYHKLAMLQAKSS